MNYLIYLLLLSAFCFLGCPDSGVNPPSRLDFTLTAEEVVSIEALIKIQYASPDSTTVQVKRNGQTIAQNLRMQKELVVNDTLLQPKHTYAYTAYKIESGKAVDSTSPLQITTLDTTNSEFTWETTTFGGTAGSCILNDVAVVNDTLAYAVGKIWIKDTSMQDEILYNALKWDGKKWELLKIAYDYNGQEIVSEIQWVFALSENDIWFGNSVHWNALQFHNVDIGTQIFYGIGTTKMWARSNNELYVVGNKGTIAYSSNSGSSWQKIESGTNLNMQDIWGVPLQTTSSPPIFIGATTLSETIVDTRLLKISSSNIIDSMSWNSSWLISSVWTSNGKTLYIGSGSLIKYRGQILQKKDFGIFISRVRGTTNNDVFISGSFGFISHFNGTAWHEYRELTNYNVAYRSLSVHENIVAAVGFDGDKAIVTIGKRR